MATDWNEILDGLLAGSMTGGLMFPVVLATLFRRLDKEETRGTRALVYIIAGWVWFAAMFFLLLVLPWLSRSG